jgi:hypothetical protein
VIPGDVGMVQRGQDLGLAGEPRDALLVGREGGWQQLERDLARQRPVTTSIQSAPAPVWIVFSTVSDVRSTCEIVPARRSVV